MKIHRRQIVKAVSVAGLALASPLAWSQSYPDKPVRIIVPTAAGSGSDQLARAIAQKLSDAWSSSVVVENRSGASGIVGVEAVARAPADGYTLLFTSASPITINPLLYKKLPYDSKKDLTPVAQVGSASGALLINAATPVNTLAELVALAKSKPNQLSYGSFGNGSGGHLAVAAFCKAADIQMIHVPYKGTAPAVSDLLAGQITAVLTDLVTAQNHIKAGKLRALAINGSERSSLLPDVKTFTEQGFASIEHTQATFGILAPTGTPAPIIEKVSRTLAAALQAADIQERFGSIGYRLKGTTANEFAIAIQQDSERWSNVIKSIGGVSLD
jgi:tripartite-type tricarboxylate transporter receptor subunit TctC